eukprot:6379802-Karenia_brevis.AAC.1
MVAVVQCLPSRKISTKGQLTVTRPSTIAHLAAEGIRLILGGTDYVAICAGKNGPRADKKWG